MYQQVVSSTKEGLRVTLYSTGFLLFFCFLFNDSFFEKHAADWFVLLFFVPTFFLMLFFLWGGILQIISKKNWRIRIDELGLYQDSADERLAPSFNVCWKDVDAVTIESDEDCTNYYYLLLKDGNKLPLGRNCLDMGEVIEQIRKYTGNRLRIKD